MTQSVTQPVASAQNETSAKADSDKEMNFARLRQVAEQEKQARLHLEERLRQLEQSKSRSSSEDDDEEDDEPYVDKRKLNKTLAKWDGKIERQIEEKVEARLAQERQKDFLFRLKSEYRDFDEVMNNDTVNKFAEKHPELAEEILAVPDEYKRRKMAYQNIKALRIHEKEKPELSAQERIDQNQRNPYYRPSAIAPPPSQLGDFSEAGKKASYERMKQMQQRTGRA